MIEATAPLPPPALRAAREALARRLGLRIDPEDASLPTFLARRMRELGTPDLDRYLEHLEDPAEWRRVVAALTTGETSFYRHAKQLQAFAAELPALVAAAGDRPVRVLCAGCSTGEEAWTLALLARDALSPAAAARVNVVAVDVNGDAIERARLGRYSDWAARDLPGHVRRAAFRVEGAELVVAPALAGAVSFHERNLMEDGWFWRPDAFDVIFCRNVAMYLTRDAADALFARFTRAIRPNGLLFLGPVEALRPGTSAFTVNLRADACFYRKRGRSVPAEARPVRPVPPQRSPAWAPATRLGARGLRALLRAERYSEAVLALSGRERDEDLDARLIRAVGALGAGATDEGERLATSLLQKGAPHAGAHYLLALCREHAGDHGAAVDHLYLAILQDPSFALPHLQLGRLARRCGDLPTARRALAVALRLLPAEEEVRILLYGGGFHRAALLQLCRAEAAACGEEP